MTALSHLSEASLENLDKLFLSACSVCDNILNLQPDLLLCLMHSGWAPTYAAQVLWQHTQTQPFPPVVCSNIGLEKAHLYSHDHRGLLNGSFMGDHSLSIEIGRFLAWLISRTDWQEQLRQQIAAALQSDQAPHRILAVDDKIFEGHTHLLTRGLINIIYPQCELYFLDAESWYRSEFTNLLLENIGPSEKQIPERNKESKEFYEYLDQVAVGSEDITADSLDWQPISTHSQAVQFLAEYHPAEEWLRASQAIYATIAAYVAENAASYTPDQADSHGSRIAFARPDYYLLRDIWLENGITRRQAMQRYGISSQDFDHLLGNHLRFDMITRAGHGRGTRYVIQPHLRRYLEGLEDTAFESEDHYWVLPGRLMFDGHPLDWGDPDLPNDVQKVSSMLLERGIDCWLDVQIIEEGKPPIDLSVFEEEAKVIGRKVLAIPVPVPILYSNEQGWITTRPRRPNRKDIRPILELIDQYLDQDRVVCVTADESLRGILAGCYLARHGQSGAAALKALQACRATGPNGWRREPPFDEARRYIRSWPAGL